MNYQDNPETGIDTTAQATTAADPLAELREQFAFATAHPFVPGPVRQALPLLLAVIERQQADICELQSALDSFTTEG